MKSTTEFKSAVYAKAKKRRREIARRRQGGVATACVIALMAAIAVPLQRGGVFLPAPSTTELTLPHTEAPEARRADDARERITLVLKSPQEAERHVKAPLENREDEEVILSNYKAENDIESETPLEIINAAQPQTVKSREDLALYLKSLEVEEDFGKAVEEYDESYFEGHILVVSAVDIAEPEPEPAVLTETDPEGGAAGAAEPEATQEETTAAFPDAERQEPPEEKTNPLFKDKTAREVKGLLLVPVAAPAG